MNIIYQKTIEIIKKNDFLFIFIINIRAYGIYFLNKIYNYKQEKNTFYKHLG